MVTLEKKLNEKEVPDLTSLPDILEDSIRQCFSYIPEKRPTLDIIIDKLPQE